MNDLVNRLRRGPYHEPEGVEPENEEQVWNWWCEITDAAAARIEAQDKLIEEMRWALKPFADNASDWDQDWVDNARSALSKAQSLQNQKGHVE